MTSIEHYLRELNAALRVRGSARRRLLTECREHLVDASSADGVAAAIRRFGSPSELAEAFDTEIALRRGLRSTVVSVIGVLAVGLSAWAMLTAVDSSASAVPVWAVMFFGCAQTAWVSIMLAGVQAAAMRHGPAGPPDLALLCRRNETALVFATLTLLAAAAAVPGHTAAWKVLAGPAVALLAAVGVLRTRWLARGLDGFSRRAVRSPAPDLCAAVRRLSPSADRIPSSSSAVLLVPTVVMASAAAFLWDHLDHGDLGSSVTAASVEAAMTLGGFLLLGPTLGLRWSRSRGHEGAST